MWPATYSVTLSLILCCCFPVVVFPSWRLGVSVFGSLLPGRRLGVSTLHLFPRLEARSINFPFLSQAGWSEYQLSIFITSWRLCVSTFICQAGRSEYELLALLIPAKQSKQNRSIPNWRIESRNPGHRGNKKLLDIPPGEPSLTHTFRDGRKRDYQHDNYVE